MLKHRLRYSDNYDKAAHDRLLSKAHNFCASIASRFPSASPSRVKVSLGAVECNRSEEAAPEGKAFYTAKIESHEALAKWVKISAKVPNVGTVQFTAPGSSAFTVRLLLPSTMKASRFALSDITVDGGKPLAVPPSMPSGPSAEPEVAASKSHVDVEAARRPVSKTKPPVTNALDQLSAIGFELVEVERKCDCFPLGIMAGHDISAADALRPTSEVRKAVKALRGAGVDVVAGSRPIGAIDSRIFRAEEGLKRTSVAAAKEMAPYR